MMQAESSRSRATLTAMHGLSDTLSSKVYLCWCAKVTQRTQVSMESVSAV
jgi:hypothetical protein